MAGNNPTLPKNPMLLLAKKLMFVSCTIKKIKQPDDFYVLKEASLKLLEIGINIKSKFKKH